MRQLRSSIGFEDVGIGEALLRNRLSVPLNQREYSWEEKHVLDLFHDITGAIDNGKSSYFLGTIVLTPTKDDIWEVADGQQRLATITILLAAIRDYFESLKDDLLVHSLNEFLFTVVRGRRERNPRLRLNVDDNNYFHNRILLSRDIAERKNAKPQRLSHERIELATKLAEDHVQSIISSHSASNKIARLNTLVDFIETSAIVIVMKVPDDLNAYIMFETLNDRGLKTSQSDMVKNYLFSQTEDRLNEAQQKWAKMVGAVETLNKDDIVITYLRHFLISRYGHTRERDVLEKVKNKVAGKQKAMEFLGDLADDANDYVALLTSESSKWNIYDPSVRGYIRTMHLLEMLPMRPLMLSVVRKFSKAQFEKSFRLFVSWSVRFLISGGGRSGTVEEAFAKAAVEIHEGRITNVTGMTKQLDAVIPSDAEFQNAFTTARVSKNDFARYYLRSMDLYKEGHPRPECIQSSDNFVYNLEHILPETPQNNWPNFDPAIVSAYYKRIGNMVLLKEIHNSRIGNLPFRDKLPYFKDSKFILTQEVGQEIDWEPKSIDERQKRLAKIAVKTWPFRLV